MQEIAAAYATETEVHESRLVQACFTSRSAPTTRTYYRVQSHYGAPLANVPTENDIANDRTEPNQWLRQLEWSRPPPPQAPLDGRLFFPLEQDVSLPVRSLGRIDLYASGGSATWVAPLAKELNRRSIQADNNKAHDTLGWPSSVYLIMPTSNLRSEYTLRPLHSRDRDFVLALLRDPVPMRYFSRCQPKPMSEALAYFNRWNTPNEDGTGLFLVMLFRGSPVAVSGVELHQSLQQYVTRTIVQPQFWGNGIGTQTRDAAVSSAFSTGSVTSIYAYIHPENSRAISSVTKSGFVNLGLSQHHSWLEPRLRMLKNYQPKYV